MNKWGSKKTITTRGSVTDLNRPRKQSLDNRSSKVNYLNMHQSNGILQKKSSNQKAFEMYSKSTTTLNKKPIQSSTNLPTSLKQTIKSKNIIEQKQHYQFTLNQIYFKQDTVRLHILEQVKKLEIILHRQTKVKDIARQLNSLFLEISNINRKSLGSQILKKQFVNADVQVQMALERLHRQKYMGTDESDKSWQQKESELQQIAKSLQQKNIELQEQNNVLSLALFNKEEQILLLKQEKNFLSAESQSAKSQKTQLANLYQSLSYDYKEFKKLKASEIQGLQSEKLKWEKQCKLRRNQSDEVHSFEDQKVGLIKEVEQLRVLCLSKSSQSDDNKKVLFQQQNKCRILQVELQRVRKEVEMLKRSNQPSISTQSLSVQLGTKQVQKLKNEIFDSIGKVVKPSQLIGQYQGIQSKKELFSKSFKDREQKLKALEEIHCLIRRHKNQIQE